MGTSYMLLDFFKHYKVFLIIITLLVLIMVPFTIYKDAYSQLDISPLLTTNKINKSECRTIIHYYDKKYPDKLRGDPKKGCLRKNALSNKDNLYSLLISKFPSHDVNMYDGEVKWISIQIYFMDNNLEKLSNKKQIEKEVPKYIKSPFTKKNNNKTDRIINKNNSICLITKEKIYKPGVYKRFIGNSSYIIFKKKKTYENSIVLFNESNTIVIHSLWDTRDKSFINDKIQEFCKIL